MQSTVVPWLLLIGGICAALYFAHEGQWLAFAAASLVAAIGVQEVRAARIFNDDVERFERE